MEIVDLLPGLVKLKASLQWKGEPVDAGKLEGILTSGDAAAWIHVIFDQD